jgi:hypothetical protein
MRLRTVGLKLSLALVGLVAGALAIVYFAVVPGLENRLIDNRLSQLHRTSDAIVSELLRDEFGWEDTIDTEAQRRGVRITIYQVFSETSPIYLSPVAESQPLGQSAGDPIAHRAVETGRTRDGVVARGNSQVAEVAVPFRGAYVLLVGAPLDDTLENVSFVRGRGGGPPPAPRLGGGGAAPVPPHQPPARGARRHWTSVNGGSASSCGSNTASTGAPIGTAWRGSPSRLPIIRMLPACGSSTSTTM